MDISVKSSPELDMDEVRFIALKDGSAWRPAKKSEGGGLVCLSGSSMPKREVFLEMMERAEALNSPGGENFETTRRLLEGYRAMAFSQRRSDPFDLRTAGSLPRAPLKAPRETPDSRPRAPLRPLNCPEAADAPGFGSSLLTSAVQQGIEAMLASASDDILDAGELLYARFIKPEYAAKTADFYMALFRSSRATYFRLLNKAVSLLSARIFGLLPEDRAPADE